MSLKKRLLVALLLYFLPPLIYWVYAFALGPTVFPMIGFLMQSLPAFLTSFIAYPALVIGFQAWFVLPYLITYYLLVYGLLFFYWKKTPVYEKTL